MGGLVGTPTGVCRGGTVTGIDGGAPLGAGVEEGTGGEDDGELWVKRIPSCHSTIKATPAIPQRMTTTEQQHNHLRPAPLSGLRGACGGCWCFGSVSCIAGEDNSKF
mmetsp:Transcript_31701/g.74613  ORF Transcript_31701/g.74613 Transcript_31701/m.74613 type:complete len:107 (-) Transcript_31701:427-747(-)